VGLRPFLSSRAGTTEQDTLTAGMEEAGLSFCFGNDVKAKHLFCLFPGKLNKVRSLDTVLYTGAGHYSKEKKKEKTQCSLDGFLF